MSMLKKDAKPIRIMEQNFEDIMTGLTFQFSYNSNDGTSKLTLYGDILPFGNRDIIFNAEGQVAGGGSAVGGSP